jgi:NADH-quinone oxidoreductase subunit M
MLTFLLIILPLVSAVALFFVKEEKLARSLALTVALAEFLISMVAVYQYFFLCHCKLLFTAGWMGDSGITLKFGMDGLSMMLTLLTTFLMPLIVFVSFGRKFEKPGSFYSLVILMQAGLIGVFTALDGMMFYIFWELSLIPAYFIAAYWGGENRIRITLKFFIYTFTGSLLMLVALVYVYFRTAAPHSFESIWMFTAGLSRPEQLWIFLAFFLAFAIKVPVFPFHSWQPDTYETAPFAGSSLLGSLMSKMGLFGMMRWMMPVAGSLIKDGGEVFMVLAVTGIVYASIIAIRQDNLKRLVAWSSIAHLGLVAAGIIALKIESLQGSVMQMAAHGINIAGLFIILQYIEDRTGTLSIRSLGGIALKAPRLAVFFMIILLGSVALPLTNGFVGEFMILLGLYKYHPFYAVVAGMTIILSAVYMLWMYQRVMLGESAETTENIKDINFKEMIPLAAISLLVIWMGVYPSVFLKLAENGAEQVMMFVK